MALPTSAGDRKIGDVYRFPPSPRSRRVIRGNRYTSPIFQKGFTYLAALIAVGVLGAVLAAAGELASHAAKREKEAELLFVGQQYRQAIASYYERSPGGAKRYPQTLEDLLLDRRMPAVQRHLRKRYRDPVTGGELAAMEAPGGGVMGVYSPSSEAPAKVRNFTASDEGLLDAASYAEWKFFYQPVDLALPPGDQPPDSPNGLSASQPGNTAK